MPTLPSRRCCIPSFVARAELIGGGSTRLAIESGWRAGARVFNFVETSGRDNRRDSKAVWVELAPGDIRPPNPEIGLCPTWREYIFIRLSDTNWCDTARSEDGSSAFERSIMGVEVDSL